MSNYFKQKLNQPTVDKNENFATLATMAYSGSTFSNPRHQLCKVAGRLNPTPGHFAISGQVVHTYATARISKQYNLVLEPKGIKT